MPFFPRCPSETRFIECAHTARRSAAGGLPTISAGWMQGSPVSSRRSVRGHCLWPMHSRGGSRFEIIKAGVIEPNRGRPLFSSYCRPASWRNSRTMRFGTSARLRSAMRPRCHSSDAEGRTIRVDPAASSRRNDAPIAADAHHGGRQASVGGPRLTRRPPIEHPPGTEEHGGHGSEVRAIGRYAAQQPHRPGSTSSESIRR